MMQTTLFTLAALAISASAAVHKRQDGEITMPVVSLPVVSSNTPVSTDDVEVSLPVVSSTLPQETTDVGGGDDSTFTLPVESSSGIFEPTNTTISVPTTTAEESSTLVTEITTTDSAGEDVTITSTEVVEPTDGGNGDENGDDPATTLDTTTEPGAAPTHFVGNAAAGLVALAGLAVVI